MAHAAAIQARTGCALVFLLGYNQETRTDTPGIHRTGMETFSFGEWLKQRREHLRLTQRALAATVHCSAAMIRKCLESSILASDALKIGAGRQR
jgi:hypothetical protein